MPPILFDGHIGIGQEGGQKPVIRRIEPGGEERGDVARLTGEPRVTEEVLAPGGPGRLGEEKSSSLPKRRLPWIHTLPRLISSRSVVRMAHAYARRWGVPFVSTRARRRLGRHAT